MLVLNSLRNIRKVERRGLVVTKGAASCVPGLEWSTIEWVTIVRTLTAKWGPSRWELSLVLSCEKTKS
jgi:hypothetical protein